ncbi:MAG: SIR2 family protein [bacterium]
MLDVMTNLAFSVYSKKSEYALLIGSGVSQSAGILTGWGITLDLIRRVAIQDKTDCGTDPADWWERKTGEEANYSKVLEYLSRTRHGRQSILKEYFEPTEQEREQGRKVPQLAHRAIARLASMGHVRVIITTNFDRLIEKALEELNINPIVISTVAAASGAVHFGAQECYVIKPNGDYMDSRIKNTDEELRKYSAGMKRQLGRVLNEYNLIVCGWSSTYDEALREAFQRRGHTRFDTFWTKVNGITSEAEQLVRQTGAIITNPTGADDFFVSLADRVEALTTYEARHPITTPMAVAMLKRQLGAGGDTVIAHDLVIQETERVRELVSRERFPIDEEHATEFNPREEAEYLAKCQQRKVEYRKICDTLIALVSTGCYHGTAEKARIWQECLDRLAALSESTGNPQNALRQLELYPALLILYAGGIAAMAADRYDNLAALMLNTLCHRDDQDLPLIKWVNPKNIGLPLLSGPHAGRRYMLVSESSDLHNVLREALRHILPNDARYSFYFDQFEYLLGITHADLLFKTISENTPTTGIFVGRFILEEPPDRTRNRFWDAFNREYKNSAMLKANFFKGDIKRLQAINNPYDNVVYRLIQKTF